MLSMLYTVCSTYFSCLFVQWAANIPALQGSAQPFSPPSMPCSPWLASYLNPAVEAGSILIPGWSVENHPVVSQHVDVKIILKKPTIIDVILK